MGSETKISPQVRPEGMSLKEWQTALRRRAAAEGNFTVVELPERNNPGLYSVSGSTGRRSYRAAFYGDAQWNHCDCMDFRTNGLGTCKHLEAVALWLQSRGKKPAATMPSRPAIYVSYSRGRRLKLRLTPGAPRELGYAAMRYFDDDNYAVDGMITELPAFIENARRIDRSFHVSTDALTLILEERDRRRRAKIAGDIDIDAVLRVPLYPYQKAGVRFAFEAGRCLIADEMGLGKTVQAIGAAELLRKSNIIGTVMVLCPTSLKYQWKKEIEKFTHGATVTVVEGVHTRRRDLYDEPTDYKIVSYHTLANDIKAMGGIDVDMVIMDEVQRLKNWNTQISQAARRVNADYCVVLSGTPLENKLDELYSVMQFVDQYALGPYYEFIDRHVETSPSGKIIGYRNLGQVSAMLKGIMLRRRKVDVDIQLPRRADKVLYVPMTREQSAVHDEAQAAVAQLVARWQRSRFLSEKDRKRLLLLLSQMRMVCDSTFILDQKTRNDTKPGEAMQQILDMVDSGSDKAVIFSQWERMTRIMADELDRAGIKYAYLHGGVPSGKRGALIERFTTDPEVRVFLSTDAGSTGLNLQAASLIINLDLPWNPAVLEQRIGRIYRLGQQRHVQVVNMVAAGTIEERMLGTLNFKSNLFAGIFDDGDDHITIDDNKLTRIVEVVASAYDEQEAQNSQSSQNSHNSHNSQSSQSSQNSQNSQSSQSSQNSHNSHNSQNSPATLLEAFGQLLQSPDAITQLVDTIVHTDADTGATELRIPVPANNIKENLTGILNAFSTLFKK